MGLFKLPRLVAHPRRAAVSSESSDNTTSTTVSPAVPEVSRRRVWISSSSLPHRRSSKSRQPEQLSAQTSIDAGPARSPTTPAAAAVPAVVKDAPRIELNFPKDPSPKLIDLAGYTESPWVDLGDEDGRRGTLGLSSGEDEDRHQRDSSRGPWRERPVNSRLRFRLRETRLSPQHTARLIEACSKVIREQGLDTLGLFRPWRLAESPSKVAHCLGLFLLAADPDGPVVVLDTEETLLVSQHSDPYDKFEAYLRSAGVHNVAECIKWALRHLDFGAAGFHGNGSSDRDDFWAFYKSFVQLEEQKDAPKDLFASWLVEAVPEAHRTVFTKLLELIATVAAHAPETAMTGSHLCRLFGFWFFGRHRSRFASLEELYLDFQIASSALEHLFLCYIRQQEELPLRLQELVYVYPPQRTAILAGVRTVAREADETEAVYALFTVEHPPGASPYRSRRVLPDRLLDACLSADVPRDMEVPANWRALQQARSTIAEGDTLDGILSDEASRICVILTDRAVKRNRSHLSPAQNSPSRRRAASFDIRAGAISVMQRENRSLTHLPNDLTEGSEEAHLSWNDFSERGFSEAATTTNDLALTDFSAMHIRTDDGSNSERPNKLRKPHRPSLRAVRASSLKTKDDCEYDPEASMQNIIPRAVCLRRLDIAFYEIWLDTLDDLRAVHTWPIFALCELKDDWLPCKVIAIEVKTDEGQNQPENEASDGVSSGLTLPKLSKTSTHPTPPASPKSSKAPSVPGKKGFLSVKGRKKRPSDIFGRLGGALSIGSSSSLPDLASAQQGIAAQRDVSPNAVSQAADGTILEARKEDRDPSSDLPKPPERPPIPIIIKTSPLTPPRKHPDRPLVRATAPQSASQACPQAGECRDDPFEDIPIQEHPAADEMPSLEFTGVDSANERILEHAEVPDQVSIEATHEAPSDGGPGPVASSAEVTEVTAQQPQVSGEASEVDARSAPEHEFGLPAEQPSLSPEAEAVAEEMGKGEELLPEASPAEESAVAESAVAEAAVEAAVDVRSQSDAVSEAEAHTMESHLHDQLAYEATEKSEATPPAVNEASRLDSSLREEAIAPPQFEAEKTPTIDDVDAHTPVQMIAAEGAWPDRSQLEADITRAVAARKRSQSSLRDPQVRSAVSTPTGSSIDKSPGWRSKMVRQASGGSLAESLPAAAPPKKFGETFNRVSPSLKARLGTLATSSPTSPSSSNVSPTGSVLASPTPLSGEVGPGAKEPESPSKRAKLLTGAKRMLIRKKSLPNEAEESASPSIEPAIPAGGVFDFSNGQSGPTAVGAGDPNTQVVNAEDDGPLQDGPVSSDFGQHEETGRTAGAMSPADHIVSAEIAKAAVSIPSPVSEGSEGSVISHAARAEAPRNCVFKIQPVRRMAGRELILRCYSATRLPAEHIAMQPTAEVPLHVDAVPRLSGQQTESANRRNSISDPVVAVEQAIAETAHSVVIEDAEIAHSEGIAKPESTRSRSSVQRPPDAGTPPDQGSSESVVENAPGPSFTPAGEVNPAARDQSTFSLGKIDIRQDNDGESISGAVKVEQMPDDFMNHSISISEMPDNNIETSRPSAHMINLHDTQAGPDLGSSNGAETSNQIPIDDAEALSEGEESGAGQSDDDDEPALEGTSNSTNLKEDRVSESTSSALARAREILNKRRTITVDSGDIQDKEEDQTVVVVDVSAAPNEGP